MIKRLLCVITLLTISHLFSQERASIPQDCSIVVRSGNAAAQVSAACIMLAIAHGIAQVHSDARVSARLTSQLTPTRLLSSFFINYLDRFLTTLGHESGHALMAKVVNGDPIDMHIGGYSNDPLFNIGPVHIEGLNPGAGYSRVTIPYKDGITPIEIVRKVLEAQTDSTEQLSSQAGSGKVVSVDISQLAAELRNHPLIKKIRRENINRSKRAAVILAGGMGGMVAHFLFKTIRSYISDNRVGGQNTPITSKLYRSALLALTPDSCYLDQLFNMLVPMNFGSGGHSDGSDFFEDILRVDSKWTNSIAEISPFIQLLAKLLVINKFRQNGSSHLEIDIPITLFNQLTEHLFEVST